MVVNILKPTLNHQIAFERHGFPSYKYISVSFPCSHSLFPPLMAEIEQELKSLLMKVKEESEKLA